MERIRFERLTRVLTGDPGERARANQINAHRETQNQNDKQVWLQVHSLVQQANECLEDDVHRGGQQQTGFDKC